MRLTPKNRQLSNFSMEKGIVVVITISFALIVISGIYAAVTGTPITGGGYYGNGHNTHYDNDSLLGRNRDRRHHNSLRNRNNRRHHR